MTAHLVESFGSQTTATVALGIDWLVQSTLLFAVGLLAAQVLRRKGAALESAICRATLVAVLACPAAALVLSAAGMPGLKLGAALFAPQRAVAPATAMTGSAPAAESPAFQAAAERVAADALAAIQSRRASNLTADGHRSDAGAAPAKPGIDWKLLACVALAGAWFVGSSVLVVRLVLCWRASRQLERSASPADRQACEQCRVLAEQMGVRVPAVLWSAMTPSPVLVGIVRPVVVLPEEEHLTADNKDILVHELAHLGRKDLLWNYVGRVATAVLCFQPLAWILVRRMVLAAEEVCDDFVIHLGFDRPGYARRLVEVAERHQPAEILAVGMVSLQSWLGQRVARILDPSRPLSTRTGGRSGVLIVVAAMAATAMGAVLSVRAADQPAAATKPASAAPAAKPAVESQGLTYQGTVVDKETGKAVEGATVLVRRSILSPSENRTVEETKHVTDAQGRYSFHISPELVADRYAYLEFEVTHPGYAKRAPEGYALGMIRKNEKLGERPFFEKLEIRPGEEISATVLAPDGVPAADVHILVYSKSNQKDLSEYGSFAKTTTDAKGEFHISVIKGGEAVLWLLPEKYAPSTNLIHQRRGDLGQMKLEPGVTLKGRVVDADGKPVGSVWVNADIVGGPAKKEIRMPVYDALARSALADAKGEFTLAPLPPSEYNLIVDETPRAENSKDRTRRPVPAVFLQQKLTLKAGEPVQTVEIKAVPHVEIELAQLDSAGKAKKSHAVHFTARMGDTVYWSEGRPDDNGRIVIKAPKGANEVEIRLMTNEHGATRWRFGKEGPLENNREIKLWSLQKDLRGLTVFYYKAPVILVKAVSEDGKAIGEFKPQITYRNDKKPDTSAPHWINGLQGDVHFEKQADGRWRSECLLPDEPFLLTVEAEGYKPWCDRYTLSEGAIKEVEVRLEKR